MLNPLSLPQASHNAAIITSSSYGLQAVQTQYVLIARSKLNDPH